MKRNTVLSAVVAAAGIAAAGSLALARAADGTNDAVVDLAKANITITQAIAAAEAQVGGRAVSAELKSKHGALAYNVEVVRADQQVFDVKIDAADAKVLASVPDREDDD